MPAFLHLLLQPMNLAALWTLVAVGLSLRWIPGPWPALEWSLLAAFAVAMLSHEGVQRRRPRAADALLVAMPLCSLALTWINPRVGTAQVLLVIWTAMLAFHWPARAMLPAVLAADLALYAIMRAGDHRAPLTVTLLYMGFQGFAALTAHYLCCAERARDALARVNADLLATRALLADSARDGERLRMARELHDVAGHKLTALTLNLRALAADRHCAARPELAQARQLCAELMADLRGVVQSMRDGRGLDLATALRALAAPFPRPRLTLRIDDDVQVTDPALAEAVLRTVQEALTNSARHADADEVSVSLAMDDGALRIRIADDGRLRGPLREGNGLSGMRERIAALGGSLRLLPGADGALRIDARLPT